MKLALVRARAPVAIAAAPPSSKRSFTATWETAVRRWLWDRTGKFTNIDDVAHEVFIRFTGYSDVTLLRCPQTFVLKVAANVVDEWCGTPRNEWPDEDEEEGKPQAGAEKQSGKKEPTLSKALAKRLQAAVDELPLRQRQALLMHVNEGLTYEQIAQKLKMSPGIIRKDLVRAYAKVRAGMGKRVLGSC